MWKNFGQHSFANNMCGIIAFRGEKVVPELFAELFWQSKIRGLHSFGIAKVVNGRFVVKKWHKSDFSKEEICDFVYNCESIIAHTRYSTSGDWYDHKNNMPIIHKSKAIVMNGVVTQAPKEQWEELFGVKCDTDNDAELLLHISTQDIFKLSEQNKISIACAILDKSNNIVVFRNNLRPLWFLNTTEGVYVCSTMDIAHRTIQKFMLPKYELFPVEPLVWWEL